MTSGAARHDLYTALRNNLGQANADTLMTYLPAVNSEELANRAEVAAMRSDLTGLRLEMHAEFKAVRLELHAEFKAVRQEMQAEFTSLRQELNRRIDRIFLAQIATAVALGAAIIAT